MSVEIGIKTLDIPDELFKVNEFSLKDGTVQVVFNYIMEFYPMKVLFIKKQRYFAFHRGHIDRVLLDLLDDLSCTKVSNECLEELIMEGWPS